MTPHVRPLVCRLVDPKREEDTYMFALESRSMHTSNFEKNIDIYRMYKQFNDAFLFVIMYVLY